MRIRLTGDTDGILEGANLLAGDLNLALDHTGIPIRAVKRSGGVRVDIKNAVIYYERPCHFYRGMMLFTRQLQSGRTEAIIEVPSIKRVGLHLDVSRNAVLTVDSVKHFLRKMALLGMDLLMLYMEDIYFLEGYDRFGYMRGRYTPEELKEIDDYAHTLSIEVMPYIQTLAHMSKILKWDDTWSLRDTEEIIMVGKKETYDFLDLMIKTLSSSFRSKRINIGMDEASELGLGNYLRLNGYRDRMQLMEEHLINVLAITEKYGLRAMIASDMLFHNDGGAADHYEMGDTTECPIDLPENLDLMYWDYFHTDVEEIREFIRRHKDWGKTPTYLGTVRTWESFGTHYTQSAENSNAALAACALEGVEEAVISVWMNDGAENSLFAALPGIFHFARQVYGGEASDFSIWTGADLQSFLLLEGLDVIPGGNGGNPSKYLFWQDPLLGLFDYHAARFDAGGHYKNLTKQMEHAIFRMGSYESLMKTMRKVSKVLELKSQIGIKIKQAYDVGDMEELKYIARDVLFDLMVRVEAARKAHRRLWMETLKPFGWEILDARYGGLCARIDSAAQRLTDYTNGDISAVLELEEKRMPFRQTDGGLPTVLTYDEIVSVGYQNGPVR